MTALVVRADGAGTHTTIKAAVESLTTPGPHTVDVTQAGTYTEGLITVATDRVVVTGTVPGVVCQFAASGKVDVGTQTGFEWQDIDTRTAVGTLTIFDALGPNFKLRRCPVRLRNNQIGVRGANLNVGGLEVDRCAFTTLVAGEAPDKYVQLTGTLGNAALDVNVRNSLFDGRGVDAANTAIQVSPSGGHGAGLNVRIGNCTVVGHKVGVQVSADGVQRLRNVVVANVVALGSHLVFEAGYDKTQILTSCFEGRDNSDLPAGNINGDPAFADEANRNWHLGAASPCRDAGTDLAAGFYIGTTPIRDLEGRTFGQGAGWEMGCYEFQQQVGVEGPGARTKRRELLRIVD